MHGGIALRGRQDAEQRAMLSYPLDSSVGAKDQRGRVTAVCELKSSAGVCEFEAPVDCRAEAVEVRAVEGIMNRRQHSPG